MEEGGLSEADTSRHEQSTNRIEILYTRVDSKECDTGVGSTDHEQKENFQQSLSFKLFQTLEEVGASEAIRQLHQQTAVVLECLKIIDFGNFNKRKDRFHICGSRYEGTVTPDLASDVDHILCLCSIPVLPVVPVVPRGLAYRFVRDTWTLPGYAKLQIMYNRVPFTKSENVLLDGLRFDTTGKLCRTHKVSGDMQGPASVAFNEKGEHIADTVFAYKMDYIPDHANEWLHRHRKYGWPTTQQLEIMSKMGCMFVRAGHWQSNERDLEWRISFSLQERLLMASLNPTQHKVYILLKMIKKDIFGSVIDGESLSSYQCKTCIFHAVERTPLFFWCPENIISNVMYCLKLLLQWVDKSYCPSYFINNQNLFLKEGFTRFRDLLKSELEILIKNEHRFIYRLRSDSIGSMMNDGNGIAIKSKTEARKWEYILGLKLKVIHIIYNTYLGFLHNHKEPMLAFAVLQSSRDIFTSQTTEQSTAALAYLMPLLHLYTYKVLVANIFDINVDNFQSVTMISDAYFSCAATADVANAPFAKASILYKYGKYRDCNALLQAIENDLTTQVIVACMCPCRSTFKYHGKDGQAELLCQKPVSDIAKNHIASCVVFSRSESRITPIALQYEMYRSLDTEPWSRHKEHDIWFDFAVVDAKVYLYFMQYLVYSSLELDTDKVIAVDNMKEEILKCNKIETITGRHSLGHKETAYNLLGWVHLQEQRYDDAKRCFKESLKIRPHHNAAKFHMWGMQDPNKS